MRSVDIALSDNGKVDAVDYLKGFSIFTIALMHLIQMMSNVPLGYTSLALFLCAFLSLRNAQNGYLKYLMSII